MYNDLIKRSDLNGLYPVVKLATEKLIEYSYKSGIKIRITDGYRSIEEQNKLYNKVPRVTTVKGGYSYHNYGVAIDFVFTEFGYDFSRDGNANKIPDLNEVVALAKLFGFAWGGDWKSFVDKPHFEMTFGLKQSEWLAGKRPTTAQIKAAENKIWEGVKMLDRLAAAEAKIKQLETLIDAMNNRNNMPPPEWAKPSFEKMRNAGFIKEQTASYDLFRTITILDRAGILDK